MASSNTTTKDDAGSTPTPITTTSSSTTKTTTTATSTTTAKCDGYVQQGLTKNKTIQFLLENLEKMGCHPPPGFIQCLDCEGKPVSGGFGMLQEEEQVGDAVVMNAVGGINDEKVNHVNHGTGSVVPSAASVPAAASTNTTNTDNTSASTTNSITTTTTKQKKRPDCTKSREEILEQFQRANAGKTKLTLVPEIYLCQEHVTGPQHAQTILTHELIHAIDMCRSHMDPLRNCMQLACTEVRAENLSGECNASWEFLRAQLPFNASKWRGHGQKCVRRRAIESVKGNPNCTAQAELYVDAVMERCLADTFPFERHPNQR